MTKTSSFGLTKNYVGGGGRVSVQWELIRRISFSEYVYGKYHGMIRGIDRHMGMYCRGMIGV